MDERIVYVDKRLGSEGIERRVMSVLYWFKNIRIFNDMEEH